MNSDHIIGAVATFAGSFLAQLYMGSRAKAFMNRQFTALATALNEVRQKLGLNAIVIEQEPESIVVRLNDRR